MDPNIDLDVDYREPEVRHGCPRSRIPQVDHTTEISAWNQYLEITPELEPYRFYPVIIRESSNNFAKGAAVTTVFERIWLHQASTLESLKAAQIFVCQPQPDLADRLTFSEWLGWKGLLDLILIKHYLPLKESRIRILGRAYLDCLSEVESDQLDWARLKRTGMILITFDNERARLVKQAQAEIELLRINLVGRLPRVEFKLSAPKYETKPKDILGTELATLNFIEPLSISASSSIQTTRAIPLTTCKSEQLVSQLTLLNDPRHWMMSYLYRKSSKYYGRIVNWTPELHGIGSQKAYRTEYTITNGAKCKFFNVDLSRILGLEEKAYQLARTHGDFSIITSELDPATGKNRVIRLESIRFRVRCDTIEASFSSGVGTSSDSYDASNYSYLAVELFVEGLYSRSIVRRVTLELLPELYGLYHELNCIFEPLGAQLNRILIKHLGKIEQPGEFIDGIIADQVKCPKLTDVNRQLEFIQSQVSNQYCFPNFEIKEFIRRSFTSERGFQNRFIERDYSSLPEGKYKYTYLIKSKTKAFQLFRRHHLVPNFYRENRTKWVPQFWDHVYQLLKESLTEFGETVVSVKRSDMIESDQIKYIIVTSKATKSNESTPDME